MKKISTFVLFATSLTTASVGMESYEHYFSRENRGNNVVKEWKNPLIEEQQAKALGCYQQWSQTYRQDIICSSKALANHNQVFFLNNSENTIRNILNEAIESKKVSIEITASELPGAHIPIDNRYSLKVTDINFTSEESSVRKDDLERNINVLEKLKENHKNFLSRIS